jgi:type II secretory pathway pseudopilin PulG
MKLPSADRSADALPIAPRFGGGFTLVEMLVAFAVGALLLVSLASIISGSMNVTRKANNSLIAYNAAAAALDLIGTDLESLASTRQPFEYLRVASESVANGANTITAAKLMFLTTSPNDITTNTADSGRTRAVMYRLAGQDNINPGGTNITYGLYRFCETNAGTVFTNYLGQTNLASGPGFGLAASNSDYLAGSIVDFQVKLYPPGSLKPINTNVTDVVGIGGPANTNRVASAEVTLTIIEDSGVKMLKNGMSLDDVRKKYGHVLGRKVLLRTP